MRKRIYHTRFSLVRRVLEKTCRFLAVVGIVPGLLAYHCIFVNDDIDHCETFSGSQKGTEQ